MNSVLLQNNTSMYIKQFN